MKVCMFGAGAIGGLLASGLGKVEEVELSAMEQGPQLQAIRERGLTLRGEDGTETNLPLRASDDPADLGPQDVVFHCVKAHQAWAAAESCAALLGPDTVVVTCQNGVPWWYFHGMPAPWSDRRLDAVDRADRQWSAIGPERVIGCSVYPAAEVVEPGVVRHVYGDKFALGEPSGATTGRVERIAALLESAGFRAPILDDIRSELWLKLWGNLPFNPISALTGATLDVVATDPGTSALAREMMLEAQRIAEAFGVTFRVDVDRRIRGAARVGPHRTSMLQDLLADRAMEIDAIVTAVQEMGRITGSPTPRIDTVLALVRQLGETRGLYPTYPAS